MAKLRRNQQLQSVANWVNVYAEKLPDAAVPEKVEDAEMDELFTFIGDKRQDLQID